MGLELRSFQTRVARRIFLLFIVCAIVPITALAALSYYQVSRHQTALQYERLTRESKAVVVSIYERLLFLKNQMELTAFSVENTGTGSDGRPDSTVLQPPGRGHFETMQLKSVRPAQPAAGSDCRLEIQATASSGAAMSMSMRLPGTATRLEGLINPAYLWAAGERLGAGIQVCVLSVDGAVLHCPTPEHARQLLDHLDRAQWPHKGTLDWAAGGRDYRGAYTNLFLEPNFGTRGWTVVVVESAAGISAIAKDFVWTFPALIVFSLGLVFMLGQYLIRRNMGPIETLKKATERIAGGELGHNVGIESGDEFEDLGRAFNQMSRRLEEGQRLLVRTARMGTMGQMASGFVHEVRQPLSAIMGLVQLVMMKEKNPENLESLETVISAVHDLDTIVGRFRSFSQESPMEKTAVNLNDVVQDVFRLLSIRFRKRGIDCRLELQERYVKVWGDYRSLQQVLSNLMINALDELVEKEDGDPQLVIRTQSANGRSLLTVTDNGRGISAEVREQMFDPFFTTKSADKGTGLGMAIVESIVHQHDANLVVESAVGKGTTIRIDFPSTPGEEKHEEPV